MFRAFLLSFLSCLTGWAALSWSFSIMPRSSVRTRNFLQMYRANPYADTEIYGALTNKVLGKSVTEKVLANPVTQKVLQNPVIQKVIEKSDSVDMGVLKDQNAIVPLKVTEIVKTSTEVVQASTEVVQASTNIASDSVITATTSMPGGVIAAGVVALVGIIGFFINKAQTTEESGEDSFFVMLDQMQASYHSRSEALDKKLGGILAALSNLPLSKLTSIVKRYPGPSNANSSLGCTDSLEAHHLRMALNALWDAVGNGGWEAFDDLVAKEVTMVSEENSGWMKVSYIQAQQLSDKKLRKMIKRLGAHPSAVPNKLKPKTKEEEEAHITTLLELLRDKHKNDYRDVAMVIEREVKFVFGDDSTGFWELD